MGFDLGHTISSVSKLALRTKRRIDKNDESNIKVYELWLDHTWIYVKFLDTIFFPFFKFKQSLG